MPLTAEVVRFGGRLAWNNARRLASDAQALLASGASRASVYLLWHIAVEELGKSRLLDLEAGSIPDEGGTSLPKWFKDHRPKFSAGLAELPQSRRRGLGLEALIDFNAVDVPQMIQFEHDPRAYVVVHSWETGWYETEGIEPRQELRERLMFVDWDPKADRWTQPEGSTEDSTFSAKLRISLETLHEAIEELLTVLDHS